MPFPPGHHPIDQRDPDRRLQQRLNQLEQRISHLEQYGANIPVVTDTPHNNTGTNGGLAAGDLGGTRFIYVKIGGAWRSVAVS